ncbi:unnamed protein product [Rhizoctonia solani]|uniref:Uncharacterized protein n=1 Tax=Rhizoctonia solani TaxID=456999 RepID=A0A8H3I5U0_9AGAM|nr:unnamed protein product [Rhizoctonia solani]
MGKPSSPVRTSPSGRQRAASTVFSTVLAFLPFLGLPVASLSSVLDGLIEGVQRIVGITQTLKKSKRQELVDFGDYVGKIVNQLVSALQIDRLAEQDNIRTNLEELHKVLDAILRQISRNNSKGWFSRTWRLLFPDEDYIPRMRRQLDDAVRAFQFAVSIELLKVTNPPSGIANHTLEPIQPQIPDLSSSLNDQVHSRHLTRGIRLNQAVQQAQNTVQTPPQFDRDPQSRTQRARLQYPVVAAPRSDLKAGEIIVAYLNVESRRRSLQHSRSPIKMMELAIALGRVSALLDRAGRIPEALEASQESAEWYRKITEEER